MTSPPSDHLLRTLAAVSPASRMLDLGCGAGRHTVPLVALGFEVYACDENVTSVEVTRRAVAAMLGNEAAGSRVTRARPSALGYPDAFFDWVVAYGAYDQARDETALLDMLAETHRVLKPGGWVAVVLSRDRLGDDASAEALNTLMARAGLALAESPVEEGDGGTRWLRGIYRRVEAGTTR